MIKNIEDLKNIQIVCRREEDIENCLNMLEELGFGVENNNNKYRVIYYSYYNSKFENGIRLECERNTYFFNKKFIKILQKLIKEKQEKKEEVKDIEVASDGRIMKINNYQSNERISFLTVDFDNKNIDDPVANASETLNFNYDEGVMGLYNLMKYGLLFKDDKALDNYLFKLTIETKLKNIVERLNKGRKIDWKNGDQKKFFIYYDYDSEILDRDFRLMFKIQGTIYCLDEKFLEVAKLEIGEDNLIEYFKEV